MLGLHPDFTAPYWLKSDADKPENERPTFSFRFLTAMKIRKAWELYDRAADNATALKAEERLDLVKRCILVGLAGWKNIKTADAEVLKEFGVESDGNTLVDVPFNPDKIGAILTIDEQWEMAREYTTAIRLGEREKKASSSRSPAPTTSADSVPGAGTETAPTNPA